MGICLQTSDQPSTNVTDGLLSLTTRAARGHRGEDASDAPPGPCTNTAPRPGNAIAQLNKVVTRPPTLVQFRSPAKPMQFDKAAAGERPKLGFHRSQINRQWNAPLASLRILERFLSSVHFDGASGKDIQVAGRWRIGRVCRAQRSGRPFLLAFRKRLRALFVQAPVTIRFDVSASSSPCAFRFDRGGQRAGKIEHAPPLGHLPEKAIPLFGRPRFTVRIQQADQPGAMTCMIWPRVEPELERQRGFLLGVD